MKTVNRTQTGYLRNLDVNSYRVLKDMCQTSAVIRRETIEELRQRHEHNKIVNKNGDKNFKSLRYESIYHVIKEGDNYHKVHTRISQSLIKQACRDVKSYKKLVAKAVNKTLPEHMKFIGFPSAKSDYNHLEFHNNAIKEEGKKLRLSLGPFVKKSYGIRYVWIDYPHNLIEKRIKLIRIRSLRHARYFDIEFVYEEFSKTVSGDGVLAIDVGLNNTVSCIDSNGKSFVINGRGLKAYNQWDNKRRGNLRRIYSQQKIYDNPDFNGGKIMIKLGRKRHRKIDDFINKIVAHIINYCVENQISNIVIGDAPTLLGKRIADYGNKITTQNFRFIPFGKLMNKLEAKCEIYNILFDKVEEDFTSIICSKCGLKDSLNRLRRGWMRCQKCSYEIHADINAAINIGRQAFPGLLESMENGDVMVTPMQVSLDTFA